MRQKIVGTAVLLAWISITPGIVGAEQAAPPAPAVADLDWLAGHWVGEVDGAVVEEQWSPPGGGVIMGMFRWLEPAEEGAESRTNRVALYEFFVIEPGEDGRPVLRLRHFDPGLAAWEEKDAPMTFRLKDAGPRRVVFEQVGTDGGAEGGEPTWLGYRQPEPGVLEATLVEGGTETVFRYARVGG